MPASQSRRTLLLASLAGGSLLALAGCGFKLRGPQPLAFSRLLISGVDPNSAIGAELRRQILTSGTTTVVSSPTEADATLEILSISRDREILSLSGAGTVREYQLTQAITFRLVGRDGDARLPATTIRARREYNFDDSQVIAKQQEEELLFSDMERDLLQQLMRRLAAVQP